jgi:hypothetical protein
MPSADSKRLSVAAKAGIGVGAAVVIILALGAALLAFLRRRRFQVRKSDRISDTFNGLPPEIRTKPYDGALLAAGHESQVSTSDLEPRGMQEQYVKSSGKIPA